MVEGGCRAYSKLPTEVEGSELSSVEDIPEAVVVVANRGNGILVDGGEGRLICLGGCAAAICEI